MISYHPEEWIAAIYVCVSRERRLVSYTDLLGLICDVNRVGRAVQEHDENACTDVFPVSCRTMIRSHE